MSVICKCGAAVIMQSSNNAFVWWLLFFVFSIFVLIYASKMIILDRPLESKLEELVDEHVKSVKNNINHVATTGFIIGYRGENEASDLFAVHLAKCPLPETGIEGDDITLDDESVTSPKARDTKVKSAPVTAKSAADCIDIEWISHNGRQLLRTLPGGLDIIGVFVLGDKKSMIAIQSVLIKSVRTLARISATVSWMGLKHSSNTMMLLSVDITLGKPTGTFVDLTNDSLQTLATKVLYQNLHFVSAQSHVALYSPIPFVLSQKLDMKNFRKVFLTAIQPLANELLTKSICSVDGELRDLNDQIINRVGKHGQKTNIPSVFESVNIDIYIPNSPSTTDHHTKEQYGVGSLQLKGTVQCRAVVSHKATVGMAQQMLIQDLLRSLYTRAELHYESMAVVEDEYGDPLAIHQLPRRVLIIHPNQPSINFSDYLFEGDTVADAIETFRDVLGLLINEDAVNDNLESLLSEEDLERLEIPLPVISSDASISNSPKPTSWILSNSLIFPFIAIFGVILAFVIYLILNN